MRLLALDVLQNFPPTQTSAWRLKWLGDCAAFRRDDSAGVLYSTYMNMRQVCFSSIWPPEPPLCCRLSCGVDLLTDWPSGAGSHGDQKNLRRARGWRVVHVYQWFKVHLNHCYCQNYRHTELESHTSSSMNDYLANVPVVIPPPGTISNFNNPASRATLVIVPNTVSLALMLLFVSLRIYSKVRHHRSFDGSDCKYHLVNREPCVKDWQMPVCSRRWTLPSLRQCSRSSDRIKISFWPSLLWRSPSAVGFSYCWDEHSN